MVLNCNQRVVGRILVRSDGEEDGMYNIAFYALKLEAMKQVEIIPKALASCSPNLDSKSLYDGHECW